MSIFGIGDKVFIIRVKYTNRRATEHLLVADTISEAINIAEKYKLGFPIGADDVKMYTATWYRTVEDSEGRLLKRLFGIGGHLYFEALHKDALMCIVNCKTTVVRSI